MGVAQVRTNASRRSKSRRLGPQSPIDHAKTHEVAWQEVAPLFDAARRISNASFIYVISEDQDGPVKIGLAKDPIKRLRTMQTGNSRRLRVEFVLLGERNLERLMHEMWEPFAIRSVSKQGRVDTNPGTEWFRPEIRGPLFDVIPAAVEQQIAYVLGDEEKAFDRLAEIVFKAHRDHGIEIHERDEVRLLGQGGGYAVGRESIVKFFRDPSRRDA